MKKSTAHWPTWQEPSPKLELLALPPPISSKTRPKMFYLRSSTWSPAEVTGLSASGSWKMVFVVSFSWRGSADKYKLKICAPTMRNQFYCVCRRHFPSPDLGGKFKESRVIIVVFPLQLGFFFCYLLRERKRFSTWPRQEKRKIMLHCVCLCV